jgi:hypothetical protein
MAEVVNHLSLLGPRFVSGLAHVEFMADRVAWVWSFSEFFSFPLSLSFHHGSIFIYHLEVNNMPVDGCGSETVSPY